jgi:hypothetical protein
MKIIAIILAIFLFPSITSEQLKSEYIEIPQKEWKSSLKPVVGEYNASFCGKGKFTPYHIKLADSDPSFVLISYYDNKTGITQSLKQPIVFNLTSINIYPDDDTIRLLEFHWIPDKDSSFKVSIFVDPSRSRVVGFFTEDSNGTTVMSSIVLMERGDVDKLPSFSESTFDVCKEVQGYEDEDVIKIMSLWATGHYKPKHEEVEPRVKS